jgi:dTDP-4-amino-4,6-dideoxygalactose transaminase
VADELTLLPAILGGNSICRVAQWPVWPAYDESDREALLAVLASREWGGNCDAVLEFEEAFATHVNAAYCVATANCTLSLHAALHATDVGRGDEVIVPAYTFPATAYPVLLMGATPVFADIDLRSFTLDPKSVEDQITPATRAIIVVHYGGCLADMKSLRAIADRHALVLIEDAAHAPMATREHVGAAYVGDVRCFSFESSKALTSGEGGALVTGDAAVTQKLRAFVNQGRNKRRRGEFLHKGSNCRMSAWQAAILACQLQRLPTQHRRRTDNARRLVELLSTIEGFTPLIDQSTLVTHSLHCFVARYDKEFFNGLARSAFCDALEADGIPCEGGYARPLYEWPPFRPDDGRIGQTCPNAELACRQNVSFRHNILLAAPNAMEDVALAISRIHVHSKAIAML